MFFSVIHIDCLIYRLHGERQFRPQLTIQIALDILGRGRQDGQAGLRFADEATVRTLRPGDYLWIPAHCRHRVEWTGLHPPAVWLALHLDGDNAR